MTRCKNCNGRRVPPKNLKPLYRTAWEQDTFCSSACCKSFHGVVSPGSAPRMGGGAVGYEAAA